MQYGPHRLRHEQKYLISSETRDILLPAFRARMAMDSHSGENGYLVRSLYFDDIYDSAYKEKEAGVFRRRKHRVRIYNCGDDFISYEIKDKFDNYISKISARITIRQFGQLMRGDCFFMAQSEKQALRLGFIDMRTKLLHPSVVVDYDRIPFVGDEGNVRVTFDCNLRAGISSDIFNPDLVTVPAMDFGQLILEVKYDDYLPDYVKRLLASVDARQTSLSKYTMCRQAQNTYYGKECFRCLL